MGRVEKFRQMRVLKQKYIISAVLLLAFLGVGLCIADFSVNSLMNGQSGLGIINMTGHDDYIEVIFMNKKIRIDTEYVNKDLQKLEKAIAGLVGK